MQLITLISILPFLAALTDARGHNPNGDIARRAHHRGLTQERANVEVRQEITRREALARQYPGEVAKVGKRTVKKRGAAGCRVRGQTLNATSSSVTLASSTSTAVVTTSAVGDANFAQGAASTTTAAASSQQPAASSSAAAAPAQSSKASSPPASSGGNSGLTPNGIKAGVSAAEAVDLMGSKIGWWYDWDSTPSQYSGSSSAKFASMLWGAGWHGSQDWGRLNSFKELTYSPSYIMGTYEPDCTPPMSSGLDQATAAGLWNSLIVPHRASGSILVSPGMCKQADEDWLPGFVDIIGQNNMWDVTSLHINKLDRAGVMKDLDHYAKYGKPLWVTEFACVDDSNGFTPCTDQNQINEYINMIVPILESDSRVAAYAISCGEGLSDQWTTVKNGQLTETGRTYLNAISAYH